MHVLHQPMADGDGEEMTGMKPSLGCSVPVVAVSVLARRPAALRSPAWIDSDTGHPLSYCGSRCARKDGMERLVGDNECSLPGCVRRTFLHEGTRKDLGYCSEDHRLRATQRCLVSQCVEPQIANLGSGQVRLG